MLFIGSDKLKGNSAAFTLLEVMVAIAVLAIALVALLSSQSRTMFVADSNDFSITSARLGAKQFSEIIGENKILPASATRFESPDDDYFWRVEMGTPPLTQGVLSGDAAVVLQRIDLEIRDERRGQKMVITRYRFVPEKP